MRSLVLSLAAVAMTLACTSKLATPTSPTTPTQRNDASISIRFGATVNAGGTRITFSDIADSRCPRTVTCIWAGDAAVSLAADSETVVLHTNSTAGPASAHLQNATVTLVEVSPERESSDPPQKSAYVAVIRVTP
jgi:hypothetical protein